MIKYNNCNKSYLNLVPLLSQSILLYKFNAFSILTKHELQFEVWQQSEHEFLFSFPLSRIDDSFLPRILATSTYEILSFPY